MQSCMVAEPASPTAAMEAAGRVAQAQQGRGFIPPRAPVVTMSKAEAQAVTRQVVETCPEAQRQSPIKGGQAVVEVPRITQAGDKERSRDTGIISLPSFISVDEQPVKRSSPLRGRSPTRASSVATAVSVTAQRVAEVAGPLAGMGIAGAASYGASTLLAQTGALQSMTIPGVREVTAVAAAAAGLDMARSLSQGRRQPATPRVLVHDMAANDVSSIQQTPGANSMEVS